MGPKPKLKNNGVRPFTPIAKKAHVTPIPQPEVEKKPEQPEKVGLQRRNSIPKHKEQWGVSDRIKTPSPTPPSGPAPFVAKKSRPDETVSFSLPAGGFNSGSAIPSKPKPLIMQVDELFSQYFPEVKEDMKAFNETPASESIDNANEKQLTIGQKNTLVEGILEELLLRIVKISMQTNSDCPIQYNQPQKETKGLIIEPEENSRSREISPDSPIRSRNVSADSSRSGFSFNSNESLEGYKEEYASSEKDLSNKRKKRKSDNLGLNGGYWDVIGVRGVVREKLEKQESIEKDEQIHVRSEERSRRKDSSKKISKKDTDFEAGLTKHKHCSDTDISKAQPYDDSHESETLDTYISKTRNENITFVQAIISDIILSLKTIEDTESPPKQTSIKRSPPSESKPSKRLKTNVTETQAQNTEQYQITGVIPQTDYTGLFTSDSLKPVSCEIKTITDSYGIKSKEDENKTDKLTSKAGKGKSCEIERRKKFQETKCKKSDKLSSKMGKDPLNHLKGRRVFLTLIGKNALEKMRKSPLIFMSLKMMYQLWEIDQTFR